MTFIVNTPKVTDPYVENFISEARKYPIEYDIKSTAITDLEVLKKVIKHNLRKAKEEYDDYIHTVTPEEVLSKNLYEAYRLLDTLIRGAKDLKSESIT